MIDFNAARKTMVDCQLRTNAIVDEPVLNAMGAIPREAFLPELLRPVAYVDEDIELGDGRYLIEPLVLARLLQMAEISPRDAALVVGCGSGYAAAVVGRLASSVVTVESDPERAAKAATLLGELGSDNVAVVGGELRAGCPDQAPYDVIVFSGAVAAVPAAISDQLDDGGRLVAVVDAECKGLGRAVLVTRHGETISQRDVYDASTPVLPGCAQEEGFVF